MKQLPEVNASFEDLYGTLIAPIRSKLMLAGIELGVFNHLSESKTAETVAAAIGSHPENTRLFLDGLAACDLVTKKDGTYQNTTTTQEFLVEGGPTYLGKLLTFQTQMSMYAGLDDLPKLVTKNTLNFARDDMDSMIAKIYDALNPGGAFISCSEGLTHERTKPDAMVLSMISLSMGQDMCFDQGEISDSMLRVGFRSFRSRTLDTDWGPMDIDIGRRG